LNGKNSQFEEVFASNVPQAPVAKFRDRELESNVRDREFPEDLRRVGGRALMTHLPVCSPGLFSVPSCIHRSCNVSVLNSLSLSTG
jgi:hypothetical protein